MHKQCVNDVTYFQSYVIDRNIKGCTFVRKFNNNILNLIIMKKFFLFTVIIAFMSASISTSYGQESDKKSVKARENLKEANKDVVDAKKDLKEAQKDSVEDFQKFKKESEVKIKDNEKTIADLKVKHSTMNEKDKSSYQKKISELEQKNTNLKKKLSNYKNNEGRDKWTTFNAEFKHDMDELGKALNEFTIKNKK